MINLDVVFDPPWDSGSDVGEDPKKDPKKEDVEEVEKVEDESVKPNPANKMSNVSDPFSLILNPWELQLLDAELKDQDLLAYTPCDQFGQILFPHFRELYQLAHGATINGTGFNLLCQGDYKLAYDHLIEYLHPKSHTTAATTLIAYAAGVSAFGNGKYEDALYWFARSRETRLDNVRDPLGNMRAAWQAIVFYHLNIESRSYAMEVPPELRANLSINPSLESFFKLYRGCVRFKMRDYDYAVTLFTSILHKTIPWDYSVKYSDTQAWNLCIWAGQASWKARQFLAASDIFKYDIQQKQRLFRWSDATTRQNVLKDITVTMDYMIDLHQEYENDDGLRDLFHSPPEPLQDHHVVGEVRRLFIDRIKQKRRMFELEDFFRIWLSSPYSQAVDSKAPVRRRSTKTRSIGRRNVEAVSTDLELTEESQADPEQDQNTDRTSEQISNQASNQKTNENRDEAIDETPDQNPNNDRDQTRDQTPDQLQDQTVRPDNHRKDPDADLNTAILIQNASNHESSNDDITKSTYATSGDMTEDMTRTVLDSQVDSNPSNANSALESSKDKRSSYVEIFNLPNSLTTFFSSDRTTGDVFQQDEVDRIAKALQDYRNTWSRVPRLFILLQTIEALDYMDNILELGFTDYHIPLGKKTTPKCLPAELSHQLRNVQRIVFTEEMNLLSSKDRNHLHIRDFSSLGLEEGRLIGSGRFGDVYELKNPKTNERFALKRISRKDLSADRFSTDALREIEPMKNLNHRHIVRLFASYTDLKDLGLIMTPLADMNLETYLREYDGRDSAQLRTWYGCLAAGLAFLHEEHFRHRDIKPQNIVISRGRILYTDFGLARDSRERTSSVTMGPVDGLTWRYAAPEVTIENFRDSQADVWSLGIIFLDMTVRLSGQTRGWLDEFMSGHGKRNAFLRVNVEAIPELIDDLKGKLASQESIILDSLERMLQKKPRLRWPAAHIYDKILNSGPGHARSGTYCGRCCWHGQEASDDSD